MLRSKASRWAAAPYLVWMVLFIVVPLGIVVWYALTNSDGQVTLANLTSIGRYASVFGRSLLLAAVSRLPAREKKIMELRFGLGRRREHTQKEVADTLGISQSYISRLEKRIIERLRHDLERVG